VSFKDVYECTLENIVDYNNLYRNTNQNQKSNTVFHSLKIKNNSKNPFTEAPAFISKKNNDSTIPLSQDLLKFTPIGGSSFVTISESPEIEITNN
jgi:hypothetical protein